MLLRDNESHCCLGKDILILCAGDCVSVTPRVTHNQLDYKVFPATLPFSSTAADLFTHNPKHCSQIT